MYSPIVEDRPKAFFFFLTCQTLREASACKLGFEKDYRIEHCVMCTDSIVDHTVLTTTVHNVCFRTDQRNPPKCRFVHVRV